MISATVDSIRGYAEAASPVFAPSDFEDPQVAGRGRRQQVGCAPPRRLVRYLLDLSSLDAPFIRLHPTKRWPSRPQWRRDAVEAFRPRPTSSASRLP